MMNQSQACKVHKGSLFLYSTLYFLICSCDFRFAFLVLNLIFCSLIYNCASRLCSAFYYVAVVAQWVKPLDY